MSAQGYTTLRSDDVTSTPSKYVTGKWTNQMTCFNCQTIFKYSQENIIFEKGVSIFYGTECPKCKYPYNLTNKLPPIVGQKAQPTNKPGTIITENEKYLKMNHFCSVCKSVTVLNGGYVNERPVCGACGCKYNYMYIPPNGYKYYFDSEEKYKKGHVTTVKKYDNFHIIDRKYYERPDFNIVKKWTKENAVASVKKRGKFVKRGWKYTFTCANCESKLTIDEQTKLLCKSSFDCNNEKSDNQSFYSALMIKCPECPSTVQIYKFDLTHEPHPQIHFESISVNDCRFFLHQKHLTNDEDVHPVLLFNTIKNYKPKESCFIL